MVDWPATLPDLQLLGLTEQRQSARLRTEMDSGPAKMRRRFTAAVVNYQIPVIFTGAEKQTFDAFFKTTLQEGSLPFVWEDPVTDAAVSFRFREEPQFQLELGGSPAQRLWTTTLPLEKLP